MRAADFLDANTGWAVGLLGEIERWDGNRWTKFPSPVDGPTLDAVKLLSSDDGWAVGAGGTILHWNGEQWSLFESPTDIHLLDLTFVSPGLGWAVGGSGTADGNYGEQPVILEWDGRSWLEIAGPPPLPVRQLQWANTSVDATAANDLWVASRGSISHWDGTTWKTFDIDSLTGLGLWAIELDMSDAQHGWAVAVELKNESPGIVEHGVILRWDGTTWTPAMTTTWGLYGIAMVRADYGWAVGGNYMNIRGGSVILHWDGNEWREVSSPTDLPMNFVWAAGDGDGWIMAGGNGLDTGYTNGIALRYRPAQATTTATQASPTQTPTPSPIAVVSATQTAELAPATSTEQAPPPAETPDEAGPELATTTEFLLESGVVVIAVVLTAVLVVLRWRSRL